MPKRCEPSPQMDAAGRLTEAVVALGCKICRHDLTGAVTSFWVHRVCAWAAAVLRLLEAERGLRLLSSTLRVGERRAIRTQACETIEYR